MNDSYFENQREEMLTFLPSKASKILEIGCAQGNFLKESKRITNADFTVGIELDVDASQAAKKNIDFVINKNAVDAIDDLENNFFDLVICNDFLEHLIEPGEFLDKLRTKVCENAILVASIPNFRFIGNLTHIFLKKDFKYVEEGIMDRTHLRFFTYKSLYRFLQEHDFKNVKLTGINKVKNKKIGLFLCFLRILGHWDIKYRQLAITCNF